MHEINENWIQGSYVFKVNYGRSQSYSEEAGYEMYTQHNVTLKPSLVPINNLPRNLDDVVAFCIKQGIRLVYTLTPKFDPNPDGFMGLRSHINPTTSRVIEYSNLDQLDQLRLNHAGITVEVLD